MKRAIVLSGGGSSGAYEIGVWKAIKKLHIRYDIVTGTSVGALNGVLFVQKDYKKAIKMWQNISFSDVIDEEIKNNINTLKGKNEIIKAYAKNISKGGMKINNLENTIDSVLDLNKLYKSKIKYGLVTFNLTKFKPLEIEKNEIDKKYFKDYLIASASCFPAFKAKKIENDYYIDGGYYDNLPINFALKLGADEIIAIDLKEIGRKQKIINKKIKVKTITPRNKLGMFLVFDSKDANRAINLGYNDMMKEFNALEGNKFTFYKKQFNKVYKRYRKKYNISKEKFIDIIEKIGYIFDFEDDKIYNLKIFNKHLLKKINEIDDSFLERELKKNLSLTPFMIKYVYNHMQSKKIKKQYLNEYELCKYISFIKE